MAITIPDGFVSIDAFIPDILQYVNGAPSIMVRSHLRDVIIDFCNRTLVLKKDASDFEFEEDVHTYTLKYCDDRYRAIAVDEVRSSTEKPNQPLIRTTEVELDALYASWRDQKNTFPTRFFLTEDINTIRFYPCPSQDGTEDVRVLTRVTPKRTADMYDEFLFEKWKDVIQAGVISSLLAIPGATWFDAQLSSSFGLTYSRGYKNARKVTLSGTGKYPGRVIPQSYDVMGENANRRSGSWV